MVRRALILIASFVFYFAVFLAALLVLTKLMGLYDAHADEYPPGLFEHSPDVSDPHAKRWTHLPDGRWMMVDPTKPTPSNKSCDFEGKCYSDNGGASPSPTEPQGQPSPGPDALIPPGPAPGVSDAPAAPEAVMPPGVFGGDYHDFGQPPPNATSSLDPECAAIRRQLFHDLWQVYQARKRCGP